MENEKISSLVIAQIEPPQNPVGGDYFYRTYAPGVVMSQEEEIYVVNLTSEHRISHDVARYADVLILKNICDPDFLPIIRKRRTEKKLTIYEIADDLGALQPWNLVYFFYQNTENQALVRRLASYCDALQFTCSELKNLYGHLNRKSRVFPNQISYVPPERSFSEKENIIIGWAGSHGHLDDMAEITNSLIDWLISQDNVSLHLMCSDPIWRLFDALPGQKKRHTPVGSIEDYYNFLAAIDIGIAPLKNTTFNRSRSDIKFLEYAVSGVVPVMRSLEPYVESVEHGKMGFLFSDVDQLIVILDQLVNNPGLAVDIARAARQYVMQERLQTMHVEHRVNFYRDEFVKLGNKASNYIRPSFEYFDKWSRLNGAVTNGRHVKLRSTKFELLLHDGLVAMQVMQDEELARRLFREASSMLPDNHLPFLFGSQVSKEPINCLFKAIELKPDSLKAWILLGEEFVRKGKVREALESFGSAATAFPDYDVPFLRAAALLEKLGKKSEAQRLFEKATQNDKHFVCHC